MSAHDNVGNNGKGKKGSKKGGMGEGFDAAFRGYINVELDDDQKASFAAWSESASIWDVFGAAVDDGVNIAVKKDPKSTGYVASATQRREGSPNAGLCVTARAGEPVKAWLRLLFVLAYLGHHEKWEDTQPMADPDRW
jgi:hypothetical protein